MLQRWTNKATGIEHMGFICRNGSLKDEWGASIEELRKKVGLGSAPTGHGGVVMIMGRSEHEGRPVMRLEAWDRGSGDSIALIQPFRRGLFGNWPRPSGAPINVGAPPPPGRTSRLP